LFVLIHTRLLFSITNNKDRDLHFCASTIHSSLFKRNLYNLRSLPSFLYNPSASTHLKSVVVKLNIKNAVFLLSFAVLVSHFLREIIEISRYLLQLFPGAKIFLEIFFDKSNIFTNNNFQFFEYNHNIIFKLILVCK
jgi:hypothetical protein